MNQDPKELRVLLIEDNPGDARLVEIMLRGHNGSDISPVAYSMVQADRLQTGLWHLAEKEFDVVLLDLFLPDSNGLDTLHQLLAAAPGTPVIVMSGMKDESLALQAVQAGAQDYLSKGHVEGHILSRSIRYSVERKHIEEELRESRAELSAIFQNAPVMICLLDREGRVRKCNHAAIELSGRLLHQVRGLMCGELFQCLNALEDPRGCGLTPDCKSCLIRHRALDTLTTGTVHRRVEARLLCSGHGKPAEKFFLVSSSPINLAGEKLALLCLEEITDCKIAEQEAREQHHFLQILMDAIPLPIYYKDRDGIYRGCNKAFSVMNGLAKEEVIGKGLHEIWPKELADKYHDMDQELFRHPGVQVYEAQSRFADGTFRNVLIQKATYESLDGRLAGIVGAVADIHERKLAEDERKRLATAIDQAAESIVITDRNGVIQYVNPAFEGVTGYLKEEVLGENPRVLKSGKHDSEFYRNLWDTINNGRIWKGHLINKKKDGELFEEEASISPVRNSAGEIISYVAVKRDVSNEVHLQRQLRQAQKLEAVGTLAGGIAHDFNNILGAIMGFTELALLEVEQSSKIGEMLDHVLKGAKRARELVKQVLAFSRQGEQENKPVYVSLVIKEAIKLLRGSLPATIEIHERIDPNTGMIMADPTQIHQILMNLCTNAAYAMRENGGVLEIGLCETEVEPDSIGASSNLGPGRYLRLTVSDTGHGMDQSTVERIFDPYFTTKGPGEGTGLGLAVVHGIVRSHIGEIVVHSEPEKGTAFHLYFPTIKKPETALMFSEEPIPGASNHERVLLVDDEKPLVELMQRMLERLGYEVVSRVCSIEALEAFRAQPHAFDLVITDQTMPQMTGEHLTREIMSIRPGTPVILCTGFSDRMDEEKAKAMGIRGFIMKPVLLRDLADAVWRALDRVEPAASERVST
jgi:PAS domain S-box-containing protein